MLNPKADSAETASQTSTASQSMTSPVPSLSQEAVETKEETAQENEHDEGTCMPDCAEKTLITLYTKLTAELAAEKKDGGHEALTPTHILDLLNQLEEQCQEEKLNSVLKVIDSLQDLAQGFPERSSELAAAVRQALKEVQPLDLQALFQRIRATEAAAARIKDQDIILLLGDTGSGKSTTVHWLSGSTLEEVAVMDEDGDEVLQLKPVAIHHPDVKDIVVSEKCVSETRHIHAVDLKVNGARVFLCDSPGLNDTAGPEVDISNGIGIVNALKNCGSVRLVILLSLEDVGSRLTALKSLFKTLSNLMRSPADHLRSVTYGFSKVETTKLWMRKRKAIRSHKDHLSEDEKMDRSYVSMVEDLSSKTQDWQVIQPVEGKPDEFLENVMKTPGIKNPQDTFLYFVTKDSTIALTRQLDRFQLSIRNALKQRNMPLLAFQLHQFDDLARYLGKPDIVLKFKEVLEEVVELQESFYEDCRSFLDTIEDPGCRRKKVARKISHLLANMRDITQMRVKDCEKPRELFTAVLCQFRDVLLRMRTKLGEYIADASPSEQGGDGVNVDVVQLEKSRLKQISLAASLVQSITHLVSTIKKQLTGAGFHELVDSANAAQEGITCHLEFWATEVLRLADVAARDHQWEHYTNILTLSREMSAQFSGLGCGEPMQDIFEEASRKGLEFILSQVRRATEIAGQSSLTEQDIEYCHLLLGSVRQFEAACQGPLFSAALKAINPKVESFLETMTRRVHSTIRALSTMLEKDTVKDAQTLKSSFHELSLLRRLHEIAVRTEAEYSNLARKFGERALNHQSTAERHLDAAKRSSTQGLSPCFDSLRAINDMKCLLEIEPHLFHCDTQELIEAIADVAMERIKQVKKALKNRASGPEALLQLADQLVFLDSFREAQDLFPDIFPKVRDVSKQCSTINTQVLSDIIEAMTPESQRGITEQDLKKYVLYVEMCARKPLTAVFSLYGKAIEQAEKWLFYHESHLHDTLHGAVSALQKLHGSEMETLSASKAREAVQQILHVEGIMRRRTETYEAFRLSKVVSFIESTDREKGDISVFECLYVSMPRKLCDMIGGAQCGRCGALAKAISLKADELKQNKQLDDLQQMLPAVKEMVPLDGLRIDAEEKFEALGNDIQNAIEEMSDTLLNKL